MAFRSKWVESLEQSQAPELIKRMHSVHNYTAFIAFMSHFSDKQNEHIFNDIPNAMHDDSNGERGRSSAAKGSAKIYSIIILKFRTLSTNTQDNWIIDERTTW